jgi:hypothetical protein
MAEKMTTLGDYRRLFVVLAGEESKAVAFLDKKIAAQGENEEVIAPVGQMMIALFSMDKDE